MKLTLRKYSKNNLLLLCLAILFGCSWFETAKSSENKILEFGFENIITTKKIEIDDSKNIITAELPEDTPIRTIAPMLALTPKIKISAKAKINPSSGVVQDFGSGIRFYTVTAENGSTRTYTVRVSIAKSSKNEIEYFGFENPKFDCRINAVKREITGILPENVDLTKLQPIIRVSKGASIAPQSGVPQDFSKEVSYKVTAEDGSSNYISWRVMLSVAKSSQAKITSFKVAGIDCKIDSITRNITAELPENTNLASLIPTISISPKATINPQSEVAQNFLRTFYYSVTPESGINVIYTVNLTTVKSSQAKITSFTFTFNNLPFAPATVTINENNNPKTIKFRLPPSVSPYNLTPTIVVSPNATISSVPINATNFRDPVSYAVIAQNGSSSATYQTELLPNTPTTTLKIPEYLCIYYGWPSAVNGSGGDTLKAAKVFEKYDIIVLGGGLEENSHPDHAKTKSIIAELKRQKPSIKIFGYIAAGVGSGRKNYLEPEIKARIDWWQAMQVIGIFVDEFEYEFGATRARQNIFVNYAHQKGLLIFANGGKVEDALGDYMGEASRLRENDYYLMESFFVTNGAFGDLLQNKNKADLAYYYMKTKKVKIACVALLLPSQVPAQSTITSDYFKYSWYAATMYNFDAYQLADSSYSTNNKYLEVDAKVRFIANPTISNLGTPWLDYDWVRQLPNNQLERETNTGTKLYIGNNTGGIR